MTFRELFRRLFGVRQEGEWQTCGPDPAEYPTVTVADVMHVADKVNHGEFKEGRWSLATYQEMHPGRIGRAIVPRTLVVHTTDMRPGTFGALVRNWTSQLGRGNGAHFLIGRTPADGVVQFAPIHRNANHAGGTNPGAIGGLHPNVCSVGVELDSAGRLVKSGGKWLHPDTKTAIPTEDVFVDEKGKGWHKVTPYQLEQLKLLWSALKPTLKPSSAGTVVAPNGKYAANGVAHFAAAAAPALIGHVSINPINKTDPGPQVMKEINSW
jgi:hypothetical protein